MCFGSKDEGHDAPAPRPASNQQQSGHEMKTSQYPSNGNGAQAGGPSGRGSYGGDDDFAPPGGPPPGQRQHHDEYSAPSGPPPRRNDDYAAPSGPPPRRNDEYDSPSGPPPGRSDEYAAPSGPPPRRNDDFAAPSGPPPGRSDDYAAPSGPSGRNDGYAPPSGPPPGRQGDHDYTAPSGPPPGQNDSYAPPSGPPPAQRDEYAAPSGPPPSQQHGDYMPPPGPPPASDDWAKPPSDDPPSYSKPEHAWQTAVPDTSLFPPPPAIFGSLDVSPTSNASEEQAIAGDRWCEQYPMVKPMFLDQPARAALESGNIRLIEPAGFNGKMNWLAPGHWEASTVKNTPDRCIIGYPPLYVVNEHDPNMVGRPKTIYYEVKIRQDSRNVFVGIGFTALPYPSFRMPGWHRGSLAVHGDDGNRYVNDAWGGKEFTGEFRRGETYGIGMTFTPNGGGKPNVRVFLTRNGNVAGEWDLNEETDSDHDLPVTGLEGLHDLSCAIGTYDGVSFEAIFDPSRWMYRPAQ